MAPTGVPDPRAAVRALLRDRWPPPDPWALYRWGTEVWPSLDPSGGLAKEVAVRVVLAAAATRPAPADPLDQLALWLAEAWTVRPTEPVRVAAAHLASTPAPWSAERVIAGIVARNTRWASAVGLMTTLNPEFLDPAAYRLLTDAIRSELDRWLAGDDPILD
ncbi:MAG: hypothetical protein ABMB14_40580, partial [Myxococcota bacterium]